MYIEDFNSFMYNKTKNKNKKHFCKYCLQCFGGERVFVKHKETCLRQLVVSFKIYASFESILKAVWGSDKK